MPESTAINAASYTTTWDTIVREAKEDDDIHFLPSTAAPDDSRFGDLTLQTRFGRDKLQKKLLSLSREAKTLEEEQGINALYLAIGFLRWFEDEKSEIERNAPLILLPVSLRRNERTSTYDVEIRGDDITTNEPLKHRLLDDAGIKLPEIPETEGWTPSAYFDAVALAVSGKSRWSVDRDGMQLGFFSFAKLLMVKDLQPESWPTDVFGHPILTGLLMNGFASEPDDFPNTDRLDEVFAPAQLIQVVDADASQTIVIETVRKGRNLVVQGPPGTGKSQTITNIIASAAHDGKTVLFVAEKMAALNVVHERLKGSGLRDICLELHSRSANKRIVAEELGRTLSASSSIAMNAEAEELTRLRDRLNAIADVMHKPIGHSGTTPYRAISTLIRLNERGFAPSDFQISSVENWSRDDLDNALACAASLAAIIKRAGPRLEHPFFGVRRLDLLPTDRQRLKPKLELLLKAVTEVEQLATVVAKNLGTHGPTSTSTTEAFADVIELIATLPAEAVDFAQVIARHGAVDRARQLAEIGSAYVASNANSALFSSPAVTAKVDHLRSMLATGHSFFGRLGGTYRTASAELASLSKSPLPKRQPERMQLVDKLMQLQESRGRLLACEPLGMELLGTLWRGENTDFAALSTATTWLSQLLQTAVDLNAGAAVGLRKHEPSRLRMLSEQLAKRSTDVQSQANEVISSLDLDLQVVFGISTVETIPLDRLSAAVKGWLANLERLDEWAQLQRADSALRALTGNDLTDAVGAGIVKPDQVGSTIRYVHAESLYRRFAASQAWATSLTAAEKAELTANFRDREKARRLAVAKLIRGEHLARLPRGGMGAMGLVRGEAGKRRGHKPIRRLVSEAGSVIQQIKPVMLMSPISVAQYLPPGAVEFDLLVIDEASQVRPEDALGAILRAKQIVVVGDKRQLPPTSFFDRVVSDSVDEEPDEENEIPAPAVTSATELESILTLCEARGLNSRMLRWHYRSRHPSLIEVSNEVFYRENGGLILFPSPAATRESDGLTLTKVDGSYDRGGKRNNVIEAQAVAQAVAEHAVKHPKRSLGVVTFSTAQRDAINERLAVQRQTNRALDAFMQEGVDEEFFVKNIENVQGDERDVIFISVGYGPRVPGAILDSMAFGPVSTEGGERRLNVLFTRARFKTHVFVSFNSADINLDRAKNIGARVLKQFLQYAETGDNTPAVLLDEDPDSDFEVSVAAEIRRLGYKVDHQVGSSGFKIDLAVRRPDHEGRYMLAVECDGATYHTAVWARERDRLRQEILEGLGWRFHRVWSTDWFHRRADEVRRLEAALFAAANDPTVAEVEEDPVEEIDVDLDVSEPTASDATIKKLPDYVVAKFAVSTNVEPHEVPLSTMMSIAQRILDIEGPIHEEELARRVASLFGKQKAGSRIVAVVSKALLMLGKSNLGYSNENGFWVGEANKKQIPLRNRSHAPLSLRKASLLPPIEIAAAIRQVIADNGALSWDELPRAVALLFGFQRTGPEFRPAVLPVIEEMVACGELLETAIGIELASVD